eukprot:CAMPEP_0178371534 /NCGR_PEP_ID=MMETSP0689_2-20121128/875_1 /TAXON_ID=160604 /ORGANISM="Amphidinium massartii, Strain CS-259" /LENGTH=228 /DNA_ID=CAMNT_0019991405 /DNA_START=447 /DNA_END=1134 /DNA_ORIENTATION=-
MHKPPKLIRPNAGKMILILKDEKHKPLHDASVRSAEAALALTSDAMLPEEAVILCEIFFSRGQFRHRADSRGQIARDCSAGSRSLLTSIFQLWSSLDECNIASLAIDTRKRKLQPAVKLQLAANQHENAPEGQHEDHGDESHPHNKENRMPRSVRHKRIRELNDVQCKRPNQRQNKEQRVNPVDISLVVRLDLFLRMVQRIQPQCMCIECIAPSGPTDLLSLVHMALR